MNVPAHSSSFIEWVTLQPGQPLWESVPTKRTLRLVSDSTGRLLAGRYRLGGVVEQGTLSTTHDAYDVETREPVAIELLTRPKGAGLPSAKLLRREARRIVDTKHAGLRAARTVGVDDGVPFIVVEPLAGESLRQRLVRSGALSVAETLAITLQVIDAIAEAHAAGLAHGNLKPEKVRLTSGSNGKPIAKVMGIGVTALLGTMSAVDTRRLGTPPYLAPEQLTHAGGEADALTDVWTIGLLVFEMLTGRRAFEGASADEVARRISTAGTLRMRHLRPNVPVALEQIVNGTLAKSREQRLSLRDLRRALRDVETACTTLEIRVPAVPTTIVDLGDPCDDVEGTTDLHVWVETDLGSL